MMSHVLILCQICANIMEYCQTLLLQSSPEAQFTLCLFSPSASEPAGEDFSCAFANTRTRVKRSANISVSLFRCGRALRTSPQSRFGSSSAEEQRH